MVKFTLAIQFVNPAFLFGMLAIAIPVIVHLFNFRRFRREYFTNVDLISRLKIETQKQSRLRHLLVLALRILAIVFLVLAFAQPYFPKTATDQPIRARNVVSIYVDNSFSMEAEGKNGELLQEAKRKAREAANAFNRTDLYQLLTNDFEPKHQHLLSRDEFLTMLQDVKISPVVHRLPEILNRQDDLLNSLPGAAKNIFLLSDFQASVCQGHFKPDSVTNGYLIPLVPNKTGNIYIDSCWFDKPVFQVGQQLTLSARMTNEGASEVEKIPVKLRINGNQASIASCNIAAGASEIVKMSISIRNPGIQQCEVIIDDYPITFDDHYFFSFTVNKTMNVLSLNGSDGNRYLDALFGNDSTITYQSLPVRSLDYSKIKANQLIILNALKSIETGLGQELKSYVENGGAICLLPYAGMDIESVNRFLSSIRGPVLGAQDSARTSVSGINLDHPLFTDVFEMKGNKRELPPDVELPAVNRHFPVNISGRAITEILMHMPDKSAFLTSSEVGKGKLYILSVPLDPVATNFMHQSIFIPVFYNMALKSSPSARLSYIVGKDNLVRVNPSQAEGVKEVRLKSDHGNFDVVPEMKQLGSESVIYTGNLINNAGNYQLYARDRVIEGVSFNYDRTESHMTYLPGTELEKLTGTSRLKKFHVLNTQFKPVSQLLSELNYGKKNWKIFIWLALACLLAEILLLRFWKTEKNHSFKTLS